MLRRNEAGDHISFRVMGREIFNQVEKIEPKKNVEGGFDSRRVEGPSNNTSILEKYKQAREKSTK